ncbi:Soluble secreted antigen MPT53 precursor [Nocardia otitidiscaviarum]|uniref:Soluble secreted antigen MPT53 n=1 Tax=Nocardia otitidiscaviarum TaxID=1823 RepID=A0A378YTE7_9NOCA|nr:redoxin domain-containing protein [Nocardia otitidiscaviarum]SUA79807.1 Soluble secreted antigen MPT53 precursor [Nocardia otitidiscaviarum]
MKTVRLLLPMLVAVLVAAGCGDSTDDAAPTTTTAASAAPTTTVAADAPVPKELQFTAQTIDGAEFSGASLAGKKAVLWFWAPWCPTCQREAPGVAAAAAAHPEVEFVGVAARDELSAMREFADKYGLKFTQIADLDGVVWQRFGVTAQPAFAFVSKFSDIDMVPGSLSEDEIATQIKALG